MHGMIGPIFGGIVAIIGISWVIFNFIKGRRLAIEAECALDTTFTVTCTKCKNTYEVALPIFIKYAAIGLLPPIIIMKILTKIF